MPIFDVNFTALDKEDKFCDELTLSIVMRNLSKYRNSAVPKELFGMTKEKFIKHVYKTYGYTIRFYNETTFKNVFLIEEC